MKLFTILTETSDQKIEIYDWCRQNIGPENVLWWDAKKMIAGGYYRNMDIYIEDSDQATMFALTWGHLTKCEA